VPYRAGNNRERGGEFVGDLDEAERAVIPTFGLKSAVPANRRWRLPS
jgi:hypothetical protein